MRRSLVVLALAMAISDVSYSQTTPVFILNAGFEASILRCVPGPYCYNQEVPAWVPAWYNAGNHGTVKAGTSMYPGGIPGGTNVAFLEGDAGILQTLGVTLQANTTYTLRLWVGHRADEAFSGYTATLLAGSVAVASDNSLSPPAGTFQEDVVVYKSGPAPPLLGQLLAITIKGTGTGQVNVDNVSLTMSRE